MQENEIEEEEEIEEYVNESHMGNIPPITKAQTKIISSQLDTCICKIMENEKCIGTGFFCRIRNPDENKRLPVLITNNHVLNEKALDINNKIKITLDDDKIKKDILITDSRLTFSCKDLDTTIIEIKPEDEIDTFLDVDENAFKKDYSKFYEKYSPIYILQYPQGKFASHAVGAIDKIKKEILFHTCSTENGSSGSPILLLSNFKVIGIHKGSKKINNEDGINFGIWIKFPIEEFNKKNPNNSNDINPKKIEKINDKPEITKIINNYPENYQKSGKYEYNLMDIFNKGEKDFFKIKYPNGMKKKALVIYFNDNKPSNFQEKIMFSDKNLMQKFQKKRIILVAMCDDCLNKKRCIICKGISENLSQIYPIFFHSSCFDDANKCCICYKEAHNYQLNVCKNCNIMGNKIKEKICYWCRRNLEQDEY